MWIPISFFLIVVLVLRAITSTKPRNVTSFREDRRAVIVARYARQNAKAAAAAQERASAGRAYGTCIRLVDGKPKTEVLTEEQRRRIGASIAQLKDRDGITLPEAA